jgi:hypothetical protein
MKTPDPIIDRIRAARRKISDACDNDPKKIIERGRQMHAEFEAKRNKAQKAITSS